MARAGISHEAVVILPVAKSTVYPCHRLPIGVDYVHLLSPKLILSL